jgi:predicted RND superfamily exporter protein
MGPPDTARHRLLSGRWSMLNRFITRAVELFTSHAALVLLGASILAAGSGLYVARNFGIDTNINDLLSAELPWRKQEIDYQNAFPQRHRASSVRGFEKHTRRRGDAGAAHRGGADDVRDLRADRL